MESVVVYVRGLRLGRTGKSILAPFIQSERDSIATKASDRIASANNITAKLNHMVSAQIGADPTGPNEMSGLK